MGGNLIKQIKNQIKIENKNVRFTTNIYIYIYIYNNYASSKPYNSLKFNICKFLKY